MLSWCLAATALGVTACAGASTPAAVDAAAAPAPSTAPNTKAPPTVELPLRRLQSDHIVVPVALLDNEPVDFVLDTGASLSVMTRETRDSLGFAADAGVLTRSAGAGGDIAQTRVVTVDRLSVGERAYTNHMMAVVDLGHLREKFGSPIGGILGKNFLDLHVISIDFAAQRILLRPRGTVESGAQEVDGMQVVSYENFATGGLIRLTVKVDSGPPMPAILDLGAMRTIMNWKAAEAAASVTPTSQGLSAVDSLLGADNTPLAAASYRFDRLELAGVRFEAPTIVIADLPVFATLGIEGGPAMVFGIDMLADRSIVLDFAARTLYVSTG